MSTIWFEERAVIVTGAGRGIGRAEAEDLGRRGAAVVVNDVSREDADEVAHAIEEAGGRATVSYNSVATAEGGQAIVEAALRAYGRVDALVNNAGFLRCGYFDELSIEEIEAVLDVHLKAAFFVTQPAWREMKRRGYGRVIMTSSSSGMYSHQGLANYAAAKAGLYGLTKALAFEGVDHGIKVNAILPSAATTIAAENPIPGFAEQMARYDGPGTEAIGPRRSADPVAAVVSYLASEGCEVSGEAFEAMAGRIGRVFVGVADGWVAPDVEQASAEDVAAHLDEIRDLERFAIPQHSFHHRNILAERLARGRGA